jgi:deferrochelatase/peroxidase EfeB
MTGRSTGGPAARAGQSAADQPAPDQPAPDRARPGAPSRRQLLAGAGAFGAGAVAGGLAGYFTRPAEASPAGGGEAAGGNGLTVPFYGPHQAGIATPAQDRLAFGSLNVVAGATRADLRDLLRAWTTAAARMAGGRLIGEVSSPTPPRWIPERRSAPRSHG